MIRKAVTSMALLLGGYLATCDCRAQDLPRQASPGFGIEVPPGKRVVLRVGFKADWEHQIEITDPFNAVVFAKNNYSDAGNLEYVTPYNPTNQPVTFRLHEFHKKSRPEGGSPWHVTPSRILRNDYQSLGIAVIGFDDGGGDFGFQNAVVEARIIN